MDDARSIISKNIRIIASYYDAQLINVKMSLNSLGLYLS